MFISIKGSPIITRAITTKQLKIIQVQLIWTEILSMFIIIVDWHILTEAFRKKTLKTLTRLSETIT